MKLEFIGIENIPMIEPGDDLATLIEQGLASMGEQLRDDDVLVLAQKIISKVEDRYLDLRTVVPSAEAIALAQEVDKPPNKVQAILDESNEVVRKRKGVLIVEHKLGFVQANAGIDQSNISHENDADDNMCLLLPVDPDASAAKLRSEVERRHAVSVGVIINDSIGRAWRNGSMGLAIGVSGFTAIEDYIGMTDIYGRELMVTEVAAADEMAAGASLVMGQTSEKTPVVLVRGYKPKEPIDNSRVGVRPLIREKQMDLFR
ncbi:MAG: coenzyme F420-0:L-glutamate ligase/coenzyme F420-1:gamma-L-glutamate ligase [Candidatus Azotimanducaceae bacterium]|jgi:coenzyme F420-0:L-glutamate ligase/coenzyme F420-1:gamma-L-glutamate ligase